MGDPIPVPTLVRLEYLTPEGWAIGAKSVNLLHPERYVERLAARGKIGRVTELDDQLQPTGQRWNGAPHCQQCGPGYRLGDDGCRHTNLEPSDTTIPQMPSCVFCSHRHPEPYDGSCLI